MVRSLIPAVIVEMETPSSPVYLKGSTFLFTIETTQCGWTKKQILVYLVL
jgi:hypothetical protein